MKLTPTQLLDLYREALPQLRGAFAHLEKKITPPDEAVVLGRTYPRFREKGVNQALLQKSARYISGLRAMVLLLSNRMLQEDGLIKRALDEVGEDIMFLLMPPEGAKEEALVKRYLDVFFAEEFEEGVAPIDSKSQRKSIQRREIRDFQERRMGEMSPEGRKASEVLHRAYSGYVHGFSPHLMEMWSWDKGRFDVGGIQNKHLFESHVADAGNYFFRGFFQLAAFARALGDSEIYDVLKNAGDAMEGMLPS